MAFEPAVAVFDACILYPFHLRNIVVQAAVDRLVEARWTDAIHDEWIRNLAADTPRIPAERLQITRRLMNDAGDSNRRQGGHTKASRLKRTFDSGSRRGILAGQRAAGNPFERLCRAHR